MRKAVRTVTMATVFGALGIAAITQPVFAEQLPTLRVLISSAGCVPADILAQAQGETVRIYAAAEVDLVWVAPGPVSLEPSAFALATIVRCATQVERRRQPDRMGVAPTTRQTAGILAYAFYDNIERFAHREAVNAAQILGHVMAHELGHLLLGYGAHSPDGIMRAEWDRRDLTLARAGRLTFTTQQAKAVRTKIGMLTTSAS